MIPLALRREDGAPEDDDAHVLQADAEAFLGALDEGSVDLLLTDPPYESLEKHRMVGSEKRRRLKNWFPVVENARFEGFFRAAYRALKPGRHAYVFCDHETLWHVVPAAQAAGFKFWKPLIWDKDRIGMGYHYRARYEMICFFEKGKRKLCDLGVSDVLSFPALRGEQYYPTEKPVLLLQVLIAQSTRPGELVVDPFLGSGAAAEAALQLGRDFAGCDITPEAVARSRARIAALKGPPTP